MGKVRGYNYEAVIGVGGIGSESKDHEIDGKVNWIGINQIKINCESYHGPLVIFKQFVDYGKKGRLLKDAAPMLAKRLYENKARFIIGGMSKEENNEAQNIVALAIKQAKKEKRRRC